ncbi:MAG TPA: FtsX-like permease family protein [bacterium]|nr:FtsX-like permease family protein [bacterium]
MLKDLLFLTFKGIKYRPIRSWLTVLGIIIGITLVVTILSLSSGIKSAIGETLQMFGSDLIMIFPGKETNPIAGFIGGQKFRERDLMALENIEGVKFIVPMEIAMLNIEYKGEKKSVMIHGAPWDGIKETYEASKGVKLEKGLWPQSDQANEVVMGYSTFNKLFKNKVKIGDDIIIKSKRMKIVGYISEIGNQSDDNVIYVSLGILRSITGSKSGVTAAFAKLTPDANINLVSKQIKFQLSKQEVVRDFIVLTPEKADRLVGNILSIVELSLIAIAFISLLVGAVGIMNTMYTSVLEKTKEIGIMKAIGASNEIILSLSLIESGLIGLVGGILGTIFGVFLAFIIGLIASRFGINRLFSFASLDFLGLFVVLLITFIVGVVSGVLPARQASNMEPAEALRYE